MLKRILNLKVQEEIEKKNNSDFKSKIKRFFDEFF